MTEKKPVRRALTKPSTPMPSTLELSSEPARPERFTTSDLKGALGVASAQTANAWADAYSQLSKDPIRRDGQRVRWLTEQQIDLIVTAFRLSASDSQLTRALALRQVLEPVGLLVEVVPVSTLELARAEVKFERLPVQSFQPSVSFVSVGASEARVVSVVVESVQLRNATPASGHALGRGQKAGLVFYVRRFGVLVMQGLKFGRNPLWLNLPQSTRSRWFSNFDRVYFRLLAILGFIFSLCFIDALFIGVVILGSKLIHMTIPEWPWTALMYLGMASMTVFGVLLAFYFWMPKSDR